jgi:predicted DNA repair protein MutK
VHSLETRVHDIAGIGGVLSWVVNTLASALIGLAVGFVLVAVITRVKAARTHGSRATH